MPKPWKYGCKGHLSPVSHMQKGPPAPDAPGMGGLSVSERYVFAAAVFSGKMNILHCPAANHSLFFQYPGAAKGREHGPCQQGRNQHGHRAIEQRGNQFPQEYRAQGIRRHRFHK